MSRTSTIPGNGSGTEYELDKSAPEAEARQFLTEQMEHPVRLDASALESITRAEVDIQISTAKRFRRSVHQAIQEATTMATLNVETAASCFYKMPRGGKTIEGPSVRLAEIFAYAWGNMRVNARVIDIGDRMITAQGSCHDLEKNVETKAEIQRRITDKNGRKYNDDMIAVTGNAACAIAKRNAIIGVIPRCYIDDVCRKCKGVAVGNAKTLNQRRSDMLAHLTQKMAIPIDRILSAIGKASEPDIDLNDMETLYGFATAIKEGTATIDELFPDPAAKPAVPSQDKAASLASKIAPKAPAMPASTPPPERNLEVTTSPSSPAVGEAADQNTTRPDSRAISTPVACAQGDPSTTGAIPGEPPAPEAVPANQASDMPRLSWKAVFPLTMAPPYVRKWEKHIKAKYPQSEAKTAAEIWDILPVEVQYGIKDLVYEGQDPPAI